MLVENSKDILYLVISFCVLWATVFLCWMFYYIMRILKNTNQIVEEFRVRLQTLSEALTHIKNRVDQLSGVMGLVSGGVSGLVKKVMTKKAEQWVETGAEKLNEVAKEAVDKAVEATAGKMKRMTKKIKKEDEAA